MDYGTGGGEGGYGEEAVGVFVLLLREVFSERDGTKVLSFWVRLGFLSLSWGV